MHLQVRELYKIAEVWDLAFKVVVVHIPGELKIPSYILILSIVRL